jgi:hypothetical protein
LAWISHERAEDRAKRDRAIRSNRHQGGVRQLPVCRVGQDAKRGKGQLVGGGGPGGNMGFRIGGEGTRFEMQGAPFGKAGHRKIDTGYVGDRRAAEGAGKPLRPNRIAIIAGAVLGDNRTGDKLCPRGETRRQAARDAKTDDRGSLARDGGFKSPRETQDVAAARHGEDPRTGGNPPFRLKSRNGDDRRAVYIPMRAGCGLRPFRLR